VTSTPQTVTVTNTGSVALSITGIGLTGADPTDFSEATTCGASLATGGSCTVVVLFTPLTSGDLSASLTVTDDAPDSPQSVSLSGGGSHDVVLTWNDSATPGVLGYNVYRGTASGTESTTPLNSTPIAGNSYADSNVSAGQTYYYVVTALGSNGTTQSADSTEASATVP
jgi:HYDIN/CFA65/VesB family protein